MGRDVQRQSWHTKEAYAADAYRMLASRELCTKCHQVGMFTASELENQGRRCIWSTTFAA